MDDDTRRESDDDQICDINRTPQVHYFGTTREADDAPGDEIKDGDGLVVLSEGVVGFLAGAWSFAVTVDAGVFHILGNEAREEVYEDYAETVAICRRVMAEHGRAEREPNTKLTKLTA